MHGAGVNEPVVEAEVVKDFIDAGADIILVPAVGTVPGFDDQELKQIVKGFEIIHPVQTPFSGAVLCGAEHGEAQSRRHQGKTTEFPS